MIGDIVFYFKFEEFFENCYHNTDLMLSVGRRSRFIIKHGFTFNISKIFIKGNLSYH